MIAKVNTLVGQTIKIIPQGKRLKHCAIGFQLEEMAGGRCDQKRSPDLNKIWEIKSLFLERVSNQFPISSFCAKTKNIENEYREVYNKISRTIVINYSLNNNYILPMFIEYFWCIKSFEDFMSEKYTYSFHNKKNGRVSVFLKINKMWDLWDRHMIINNYDTLSSMPCKN